MDTEEFDLASVVAQDEMQFYVVHPKTKKTTTWCWTFYGPGHPNTIQVAEATLREMLDVQRAKEQARVNGKKWKEDVEDIEVLRRKNISKIVARTKEFTPVKMGGETIIFTIAAAEKLLLDRSMIWLLDDILEFLSATENFIKPSPKS